MYFILSKLLLFLTVPFYWIAALLITALIVKNPRIKKRFFIGSASLFLIFSNPYLLNLYAYCWNYPQTTLPKNAHYSCAILLGGFASEDQLGKGYFNQTADRFIQAVKLNTTHTASHILVSSGNADLTPDNFREGDWVKTQLTQLNIPDSCIMIEDSSRNTFENALFSNKLLKTKHLEPPYLLVTGAFHMRRAMLAFKKEGVSVVPYPTEKFDVNTHFAYYQFIPSPAVLVAWEAYTKELVGYIVTSFK